MSDHDSTADRAAAVQVMAQTMGWQTLEPSAAERIARGAENAVRAVAERRRGSLFDTEPGDFVATLESLADPDSDT